MQSKICQFIRAGAYDYVAAEASGISRQTFFGWMRRGRAEGDRPSAPIDVKFVSAVREAQAEARASAEATVRKMDPKWWLSRMHRDKPDAPGWSDNPELPQAAGQDLERLTILGLRTLWAAIEKQPELAIEVTAEKEADSATEPASDNQSGAGSRFDGGGVSIAEIQDWIEFVVRLALIFLIRFSIPALWNGCLKET